MTSGVNELEAFIAALRLSSLISSTGPGSSESLQEGIAAFRQTLRPQRTAATGSASTEEYAPKQDDARHSSANVFTRAGEPISSTSTIWSSDDGIDGIDRTKQIGLVNTVTEVREGTSEIQDLIQSVKELRDEIVDLRSALAASNNVIPGSALPPTVTRPQPPSSAAPSDSSPNFTSSISSFTAFKASLATEIPTLPPAPALFQTLSSAPSLATSLDPAYPPVCPSEPTSPVTGDVPELVLPKSNDPKSPSSTASMNDRPSQPLVGDSVAKEMDDKSQQVVEIQQSERSTKRSPKSHRTATAVQRMYASNEGEIRLERGDKITILDFPDPPEGWLYGEISETRRGIFPARYVKEVQDTDVQKRSGEEGDLDYSEITGQGPESAVIMASVSHFTMSKSGELDFAKGTRIMVLDAPDTPGGWLYGEIVEKRRGLFLARYVTFG